jgi:hypothetical protein
MLDLKSARENLPEELLCYFIDNEESIKERQVIGETTIILYEGKSVQISCSNKVTTYAFGEHRLEFCLSRSHPVGEILHFSVPGNIEQEHNMAVESIKNLFDNK